MDFTPIVRPYFTRIARRTDSWSHREEEIQRNVLRSLLCRGAVSEPGRAYRFAEMAKAKDVSEAFSSAVPMKSYEEIWSDVLRMVNGERDVLWRGVCRSFAQSSGTSGGRSKYIPITTDSLYRCHYKGSADCVAHYLRHNPESRLFSGKALVLGGSFASQLKSKDPRVHIGDLSATLIDRMNPLANLFRVPSKRVALMSDWSTKLPALVKASEYENITNISGVPSWFLTVINEVMKSRGVDKISDVWHNLEVFFHGGISFGPYREEYTRITDPAKMHFVETYNASEGFFAVQNDPDDTAMLLIVDNDIYYEFIPIDGPDTDPIPLWEVESGRVYEMIITSSNGLWRYHLGDTVRVESVNPVKIRIAGRTKSFINAFGEELMEENAERAIGDVCSALDCSIRNYTAAPVFAHNGHRGLHQWLVEWEKAPADVRQFADMLDKRLRELNSDYDAKRNGTIFLDPLEVITVPDGTFDRWLSSVGNRKLGGQRKVPRLSNDRRIADAVLSLLK